MGPICGKFVHTFAPAVCMGRYGSIRGPLVRKLAGSAELVDATAWTARTRYSTTMTERERDERNERNERDERDERSIQGVLRGREGQPSANSSECSGSSSGGGGKDDDGEYYANMGDALRVLREDVPQLFSKELNMSIYRDDVVFTDGRLEFQGLKNYKIIFWSLRFHGKLFFRHTNVDILRIWQPEDYQIKMRWKIVGIPRVGDMEGVIDGISTYKLDRRGKIYEHSITNVQLRDPPLENPLLYGWNWQYFPETQPQLGGLTPGS